MNKGHFKRRNEKEAAFTYEQLVSVLCYEPDAGTFHWVCSGPGHSLGQQAGSRESRYWRIMIDGNYYKAHRLAWLYMTGEWPRGHIDHINRNGFDNRFCNLRISDWNENQGNRPANRNNKSGIKGVRWSKVVGRWQARITHDGKDRHLGYFDDPESAAAAYAVAAQAKFREFARTQ